VAGCLKLFFPLIRDFRRLTMPCGILSAKETAMVEQRIVLAGKLPGDLPSRAWPCLTCEGTGCYNTDAHDVPPRSYSGKCLNCNGSGFQHGKVLRMTTWLELGQPLDMPVRLDRETEEHLSSQTYRQAVERGRALCHLLLTNFIEHLMEDLDAACRLYYTALSDEWGSHLYTYKGFDFPVVVAETRSLWDLSISAGVIAVFTRNP